VETAGGDVGKREMRHVDVAWRPRARALGVLIGGERGPKNGELEAEIAPLGGEEIAGPVPPFVAKLGMRPVVGRKMKRARFGRPREPVVVRSRSEGLKNREHRAGGGRRGSCAPDRDRADECDGDDQHGPNHAHTDFLPFHGCMVAMPNIDSTAKGTRRDDAKRKACDICVRTSLEREGGFDGLASQRGNGERDRAAIDRGKEN
jgi:hypothetical protein